MDKMNEDDVELKSNFFTHPKIVEYMGLLEETGILPHITAVVHELESYKSLLARGASILSRSSMDGVFDAAMRWLGKQYGTSFVGFIWKSVQDRSVVNIRLYRDSTLVRPKLHVQDLTELEAFFVKFPTPTSFSELTKYIKNGETIDTIGELEPEIIFPITSPYNLYGLILVGGKSPEGQYTDMELVFMRRLVLFVSNAIKSHLQYENSLYDLKTGLYNHDFFMSRVNEEISRTRRDECTSSVIVIDVDKFKHFNDTYGHIAGDQVLRSMGQVIKQSIRSVDVPSRFGGEEFTILLPHADANTAWLVAERLRTNVMKMKVDWETPLSEVTISLGIFSFGNKDSHMTTNDIIRRADEAMYASKIAGRNRTTSWQPDMNSFCPKAPEEEK